MQKTAITAEDLYPDGVDEHEYHGISARKGTVAALIANIETLESSSSSAEEKGIALEQIKKYAIVMVAVGLHQKVIWKNKLVQEVMQEADKNFVR